jgi:hypothetical protein
MGSLLGGWLVNPALLAAGSLLVAAPIIIHLLSQRRYRTLDWAAMEFLIQAEQRNRRRIQIEELLLLALRCLAVLLAALLVGRPFWPNQWTPTWLNADRQEYVVLLDDSPSMAAAESAGRPFEAAKKLIERLVTEAATTATGDSLTLVLTSQPGRPVFNDLPLDAGTAASVIEELARLSPSQLACRWDRLGPELTDLVEQKSVKLNRSLSVLTDLRESDWTAAATETVREAVAKASRGVIVDVADDAPANLAVTEIATDQGLLLAGRTVRFQVAVKNFGARPASNVAVQLHIGGSLPMKAGIPTIAPNATETVPFSYTPAAVATSPETPVPEPLELWATIDVSLPVDALPADNRRDFGGQILPGIPTLIVDGDPSSEYGQSESFFLQRALRPPGQLVSGVEVETLTDAEFDQQPLGRANVIHLCNLYQMSEARRAAVEQWVASGGGLVIWAGAQLDDRHYNAEWHRNGEGLLPTTLVQMQGDDTEATWVSLRIEAGDHPAMQVFQGDGAALLEATKIFRWWQCAEPTGSDVRVLARFTDADRSPAIVERRFGRGRVVFLAVPADSDWSNWPENAGYLIFLQELTRSLAGSAPTTSDQLIGDPLTWPLDIRTYRPEATLTPPDGEPIGKTATLVEEVGWRLREDDVSRSGLYRWTLTRLDGRAEQQPVAVHLSPAESDLSRIAPEAMRDSFGSTAVDIVRGEDWFTTSAEQGSSELWWWVLIGLIGVLFMEQSLAGWIAQSRR